MTTAETDEESAVAAPASAVYLDSSAILRPVLESGLSPAVERRIAEADVLVTSRLSLVETARVFLRVRLLGEHPEAVVVDAERSVQDLWRRCEIWELTREVCERAELVAPRSAIRSLDALHLATFALARRELEGLAFLTVDARLSTAADVV
ncbi:MAG TPA: type II toxin-antitoxin system VapC family toxin [Thermoanaerobaculia bacterium]|nr:type II toxin-antitoxin system VapC family toxin [Thermoanaerobaculia bacterium]